MARHPLFILLALLTVRAGASAQTTFPQVSIGGVVYMNYQYNLTQTADSTKSIAGWTGTGPGPLDGFSTFNVERTYINVKGKLGDDVSFRITPDIYRPSGGGGMAFRLKYAYADIAVAKDLTLRAGVQQTQWIDFVDSHWKLRGVNMTITDMRGFFSSADLGLGVMYTLPGAYGDLNGYIFNGSGYGGSNPNGDGDKYKDLALRVHLNPFAGVEPLKNLTVAGYGYFGKYGTGSEKNRFGGFVRYSGDFGGLGAEYDVRKDSSVTGTGFSVFGRVNVTPDAALFGRFDHYNPDTDVSGVQEDFVVAGASYWLVKYATVALDYKLRLFGDHAKVKKSDGTLTSSDGNVFVHIIVDF